MATAKVIAPVILKFFGIHRILAGEKANSQTNGFISNASKMFYY